MEQCEVLVIGGGPAGSTAAALLAARGRDVVLLEREAHPRFHIGESLLPRNLRILERLGVGDAVAAIGVRKRGAEFVSDATGRRIAFPFARSLVHGHDHAFQVRRAEFDQILFDNARRHGARAAERTRVVEVGEGQGGRLLVTAALEDGGTRTIAARFVLDASGRDTFMASRLGSKRSNKQNNTAAVFAHFRGVERRADETEGYISVHLAEDGWFWMIPLPDGVMSVGFVGNQRAFRARSGGNEAFLEHRLAQSRTVSARMAAAERVGAVRATGNYSYCAERSWGDRWLMIGDAFAFIDPVFSSGVLFAMTAGERGAATAEAWLADPAQGAVLARRTERQTRRSMDRIGWLITRINRPALRALFMAPSNWLGMQDAIIAMLAGHLDESWRTRVPIAAFKAIYYAHVGAYAVRDRLRLGGGRLAAAE